jgi:hypothetical protein
MEVRETAGRVFIDSNCSSHIEIPPIPDNKRSPHQVIPPLSLFFMLVRLNSSGYNGVLKFYSAGYFKPVAE